MFAFAFPVVESVLTQQHILLAAIRDFMIETLYSGGSLSFFHIPSFRTQRLSIPSQQNREKDDCKNFTPPNTYYEKKTIMNQTDSFLTSLTVVKAAWPCVLQTFPSKFGTNLFV